MMMVEYLGGLQVAANIKRAVQKVLSEGIGHNTRSWREVHYDGNDSGHCG